MTAPHSALLPLDSVRKHVHGPAQTLAVPKRVPKQSTLRTRLTPRGYLAGPEPSGLRGSPL